MKLTTLVKQGVFVSIIIFCLLLTASVVFKNNTISKAGSTISLVAPSFYTSAKASNLSLPSELIGQLDQEAGISAYSQTTGTVNLTNAKSAFQTIEVETSDYLIGSVAIPSYTEIYDVHVFIHKAGWILAYYLRQDPVSKMMDPKTSNLIVTKFSTALNNVSGNAGVVLGTINYYDFRYPNATNILILGENPSNGSDFRITLPSSYQYIERSFVIDNNSGVNPGSSIKVDNTTVSPLHNEWTSKYGLIGVDLLSSDTAHTILFGSFNYGIVTIVYQVP